MPAVSFGVNINTQQAQAQLARLHQRGTSLFAKPLNVNVNGKQLVGFNRSLDQATSRILAFTATTTLLYQTANALKTLTSQAIQVETAITGIQAILGATNSDLQRVTSELFKTANKTGVSFFDAAAAAQEFSRAGFSLEKTLQATAAALGIVRTSGGKADEVIQGLTSTISAFEGSNLGFQEIADKLSALDAAFATSASGIIQAFSRVASFASEAGVSIDQLGALVATVKQISGRSEAQIGNSLKSIFVNLQNENVQNAIEGIGVATKNANGEFRSAIDVLNDLAGVYGKLTDAQQATLTQKVAGKFQANAFQTVIAGIKGGTFDRAVGISQGADDDIARRLELLNETTATTIQKFRNSIVELSSTLGDAVGKNFVEGLLRYGGSALEVIKGVFERGNPAGEGIAAGLTAALTGPGIVIGVTLIYSLFRKVTVELIRAGKELIKQSGIVGGQTREVQKRLTLEQQINALLKARGTFVDQNGKTVPIVPAGGAPRRPVKPDFAAIAQRANAQANFGQTPTLTLADARRKYASDLAAFRSQQQAFVRQTRVNRDAAQRQAEKELKAERRANLLSKGALGGAFLVPAVTSAFSSQLDDSSQKRKVDAVGQGVSTALIGSLFGPIGIAVGTLTGAFQILSTYTRELYGNIDDVNRVVREQINQNNKDAQSGDLFVQSIQKYNDAIKDGTPDLIRRAKADVVGAARDLSGGRGQLLQEGLNIDKLVQANDKLAEVTERKNSAAEAKSLAETLKVNAYDVKGHPLDSLGRQLAGALGNKQVFKAEDAKTLITAIAKSLDPSTIDQAGLKRNLSIFENTGNSQPVQDFVRALISSTPDLITAVDGVAGKLENAGEGIAVALAEQLIATEKYNKTIDILTKRISSAPLDKQFKNGISGIFTNSNFKDRLTELNRANASKNFADSVDVGGLAGVKGQIASQLLDAQQNYIGQTNEAKATFRKDLEEELKKGVEGSENRGKLFKVLEDAVGEGFDPNKIKDILAQQFGKTEAEQLFLPLIPSLKEFNEAVKLNGASLDIATKQISRSGERMLRQAQGGFGNPRENQSDKILQIIKGQTDILTGLNEKPGDSKLKDGQIFQRRTQTAKNILETLEAEGELGIFPQSDAQKKGSARGAYRQLFDARRVEIDQGFIGNALDNLVKGKAGSPKFAFGSGTLSANGYRKFLNENIEKGDFKAIDENPLTGAIKNAAANGDKLAQSFVKALFDARDRKGNVNSAAEVAADKFIKDNNLLTNLNDASQRTAQNTKEILDALRSALTPTGPTGASTQQLSQIFSNEALIGSLTAKKAQAQAIIDRGGREQTAIAEDQKVSTAKALAAFNSNLTLYRGGIFPSQKQLEYSKQLEQSGKISSADPFVLNKLKSDPIYKARGLNSNDLGTVAELGNIIAKNNLDEGGIKELVTKTFGDSAKAIFDSGVFDSFKNLERKTYNPVAEENARNELKEINKKLSALSAQQGVLQNIPDQQSQAKALADGTKLLADITHSLSQGLNVVFDAKIGVDVNGNPINGFKDGLEQKIRQTLVEFWKEVTGKEPVLAPK